MTDRVTRVTVTFSHPFELTDVDGKQPAGTYTIETIEEPIDSLSFVAYRRVSTTIVLASQEFGGASRQLVTIDPSDLEAAPEKGRGTRMTLMSSRWMTAAHADRLVLSFHVVLTVSVFAFLVM